MAKALSWPHITGDIASELALERLYKKGWLHAEALSDLDAQITDSKQKQKNLDAQVIYVSPTYLHKRSVIRFSATGLSLMLAFGLDTSSTY